MKTLFCLKLSLRKYFEKHKYKSKRWIFISMLPILWAFFNLFFLKLPILTLFINVYDVELPYALLWLVIGLNPIYGEGGCIQHRHLLKSLRKFFSCRFSDRSFWNRKSYESWGRSDAFLRVSQGWLTGPVSNRVMFQPIRAE